MSSSFILVDLDKDFQKYVVRVKDIAIEPISPVPLSDHKVQQHSIPDFFWFLQNLQNDQVFRLRVRHQLKTRPRPTIFQLSEPFWMIDFKSSEMSLHCTHEFVELINMLSWFSTFGGAYSNLGEEFDNCAEMAGRISVHQMKLALQLGDPFLIARCKLYYSIALIQRGFISPAKRIVRSQYQLAKKEQEADPKLMKMCLGIWSKLIYTKQVQRQEKRQWNMLRNTNNTAKVANKSQVY